ncbi:DNA adenine methylase [Microbulbifer sp. 2205BS26-8]|uniref:DNA adenine methylase n=1 Tax=Microbulbifer sp. 2205BS26-8 TaxID=3064386 RepID=UPI00273DA487|nr:DNA adenine methylase [Microbulbifer sp. 2205BS26-8]MDP5208876.1 DNA adenine methylase [Microbulbifer sp. 2205BS26-8]
MSEICESTVRAPVIRYHGGKFRLAPWIVGFFPPHQLYTEAFGGAAGVLMRKVRSHGEVYNDLDEDITNLFRVLQQPDSNAHLRELLVLTPYARTEFKLSWEETADPVERARRTVIRAHLGFGSAGATKNNTGFRTDTRRRYSTAMQIWARYPDNLVAVLDRLQGVLIENRPAIEILEQHDSKDSLHFVDPPYLHDTRKMGSVCYRHEMTRDDHRELLSALRNLQGMVVLNGYDSKLYQEALPDWRMYIKQVAASGGRGSVKRTEVLWLNPACEAGQKQQGLDLVGGGV